MNQPNDATSPTDPTNPLNASNQTADEAMPAPHPDRSGDPLALHIYRFLRGRSRADQLAVFRALPSRERWSSPERANLALRGLVACHDELGEPFSRRQYDAWRDRQVRPQEWPSSTFIRTQFRNHSWHSALDAGSIRPMADIKARRLFGRGTAFTDGEIEAALRRFAEAYPPGKRTRKAYDAFARQAMTDPAVPDMPRTSITLLRNGKPLHEALVAIGLEDERDFRAGSTAHYGRRQRYTTEAMKAALVQASQELGVRVPTVTAYNAWARASESREFCGSASITRRFGSWRRSLFAAGLTTAEEHAHARHRDGGVIATETAMRFLAACARDFGYPPRYVEYLRWREALQVHPELNHQSVPSGTLIRERLKDWKSALARAAKLEPEPGLPSVDTAGMGTVRASWRKHR